MVSCLSLTFNAACVRCCSLITDSIHPRDNGMTSIEEKLAFCQTRSLSAALDFIHRPAYLFRTVTVKLQATFSCFCTEQMERETHKERIRKRNSERQWKRGREKNKERMRGKQPSHVFTEVIYIHAMLSSLFFFCANQVLCFDYALHRRANQLLMIRSTLIKHLLILYGTEKARDPETFTHRILKGQAMVITRKRLARFKRGWASFKGASVLSLLQCISWKQAADDQPFQQQRLLWILPRRIRPWKQHQIQKDKPLWCCVSDPNGSGQTLDQNKNCGCREDFQGKGRGQKGLFEIFFTFFFPTIAPCLSNTRASLKKCTIWRGGGESDSGLRWAVWPRKTGRPDASVRVY